MRPVTDCNLQRYVRVHERITGEDENMEFLKLTVSIAIVVAISKESAVDAKDIFYGLCILLCGFIAHSNQ